MEPFLRHGDHVLTFNWLEVKVADVVVFFLPYSSHPESSSSNPSGLRTPRDERLSNLGIGDLTRRRILRFFTHVQNDKGIYLIKRVRRMSGQNIFVEGDNKKISSKVGPIKFRAIVGKVILKY